MIYNIKPSSTLGQPSHGALRKWQLSNTDVITLTNLVETPTPHIKSFKLLF